MILLVIAPYTLVAFMFYSVSYNTNIRAALIVYIAILLLNMGYAFLLPWMGFGGKEILFWNMLLKLCHIPSLPRRDVFRIAYSCFKPSFGSYSGCV